MIVEREIFLAFENPGKIGEFIIELTEDRPGILAVISNIFADNGINILNLVVDSKRTVLHFVVDLTGVLVESSKVVQELKELPFVRSVSCRESTAPLFMPKHVIHVFNGEPAATLELDLLSKTVSNDFFRQVGRQDAEIIRQYVRKPYTIEVLSEILSAVQLRGIAIKREELVKERKLNLLFCSKNLGAASEYLSGLLEGLEVDARRVVEGGCIRLIIEV